MPDSLLGKINAALENVLDIFQKNLFEAGNLRSIRNLIETVEFTKMSGILKKHKEQGSVGTEKIRRIISAHKKSIERVFSGSAR